MQCSKQMERGKGCKVADVVGRGGVSYVARVSEDEQEDYNVDKKKIIESLMPTEFVIVCVVNSFIRENYYLESLCQCSFTSSESYYARSRIQRERPTIVAPVHFRTAHLNCQTAAGNRRGQRHQRLHTTSPAKLLSLEEHDKHSTTAAVPPEITDVQQQLSKQIESLTEQVAALATRQEKPNTVHQTRSE